MPNYSISIFYFLCAFFILWILTRTLKRKDNKSKLLAGVLICAFSILILYGISMNIYNKPVVTFIYMLIFSFIDFTLILLCGYIYRFTNGSKMHIMGKIIAFSFVVFDSLVLIINPYFNNFAIKIVEKEIDGYLFYSYSIESFGSYFYIHLIIVYFFFISFFVMILYKCISSSILYCEKYFITFIIVFAISILNFLYYTGLVEMRADYSFLFFAVAAGVTYYYNYNYQPVFLIAKARSKVLEYVRIPFVLFDNQRILADTNRQAEKIFSLTKSDISTLNLEKFLERLGINLCDNSEQDISEFDIILFLDGEETHFRGEYDVLRDIKGRIIGEVFLFHNHTEEERLIEELDNIANYDKLTGLPNYYNFTKKSMELMIYENLPISVIASNINEFSLIKDVFEEEISEEILKLVASFIRKTLPRKHYVAKIDNEFVSIMLNTTYEDARKLFYEISLKIEKNKFFEMGLGFEFGISTIENNSRNILEAFKEANERLLTKKKVKSKNRTSATLEKYKKLILKNEYESEEHCERMWSLAKKIAKELNLDNEKIKQLETLTFLHDIGKLAVPENILVKPGTLDEEEWDMIKSHTSKGYAIAKSNSEMGEIAFYILSHHERWDGKGYPNGLREKDIPLLARIISVVDAFDSMTHDRPYRPAVSKNAAMGEIKSCSGTCFDPEIVEILIKILREDN